MGTVTRDSIRQTQEDRGRVLVGGDGIAKSNVSQVLQRVRDRIVGRVVELPRDGHARRISQAQMSPVRAGSRSRIRSCRFPDRFRYRCESPAGTGSRRVSRSNSIIRSSEECFIPVISGMSIRRRTVSVARISPLGANISPVRRQLLPCNRDTRPDRPRLDPRRVCLSTSPSETGLGFRQS